MNFEEALRYELNSIDEIKNNIYPLYAPKDVKAPFVVYRKDNISYLLTLDGIPSMDEATYNIFIVTNNYAQLQNLTDRIIDVLFDFQIRPIGNGDVFIQKINIKHLGDSYEFESDLLRSILQITVTF